jgi:hypothetical protein
MRRLTWSGDDRMTTERDNLALVQEPAGHGRTRLSLSGRLDLAVAGAGERGSGVAGRWFLILGSGVVQAVRELILTRLWARTP